MEKSFSLGGLGEMFKQSLIHVRDVRESDLETIGVKLRKQRDVADGRHGYGWSEKMTRTQLQVALIARIEI